MKLSRYNYVVYDSGYSYWYNSLTRRFFRLSDGLGRKLEGLLPRIGILQEHVPLFYQRLLDGGFIVQDDTDEIAIIRENNHNSIHSKDYFLVVLPTLNCNLSCWYCIQDHIPSVMRADTAERVRRHIDFMIREEQISSLHLDWFGGEPFMYFDRVIVPLSEYAIAQCSEHGIPFTNSATTNGFFLSERVSDRLSQLKFSHFQITLDGEKEFHDRVKFQKGCHSAFEHVLTNINGCLVKNPGVRIFLRINYTHETFTERIVAQVNDFIAPANRERVTVTPKRVWQEKADRTFDARVNEILTQFAGHGYNVSFFSPPPFAYISSVFGERRAVVLLEGEKFFREVCCSSDRAWRLLGSLWS